MYTDLHSVVYMCFVYKLYRFSYKMLSQFSAVGNESTRRRQAYSCHLMLNNERKSFSWIFPRLQNYWGNEFYYTHLLRKDINQIVDRKKSICYLLFILVFKVFIATMGGNKQIVVSIEIVFYSIFFS